MDEISMLREAFDPDATPTAEAEQRARAALRKRIAAKPARRRLPWRFRIPIAVSVATAAAVVTALAITQVGGVTPVRAPAAPPAAQPAGKPKPTLPNLRPVSAAQYLENAAWTAEQQQWVDPKPDQYMYVETLEVRNQPAYEKKHPNGAILPGKAQTRKIQMWNRVDGGVQATMRNGKLDVLRQGENDVFFTFLPWSVIERLTTPAKVADYVQHPRKAGSVWVEPTALLGQYVLPPTVLAAIFRYLAEQPGMKVNPDTVNIDGRPAIGMGRVLEGYLSQELLFDKQTYALIGDRLIAVTDEHKNHDDGSARKGDLFRQVIYTRMAIVDKPGQTS
jgi:hypothetical protein